MSGPDRPRSLRHLLATGAARVRTERGLGEEEAAALLRSYGLVGWQAGTLTQVEAGVRPLAVEELLLLCTAYRVSAAELAGAGPEPVEAGEERRRRRLAHRRAPTIRTRRRCATPSPAGRGCCRRGR